MNINCLLEMASGIGNNIDLKSNLQTNKSSSDFEGVFEIASGSNENVNVVEKTMKQEIKTDDNKVTDVKPEKVDAEDKVEDVDNENETFEKVEIEDDDEVDDATKECFAAILNLMQDNKIDLSQFFKVNEDGTYEINLENIKDLKIDIQNYFDMNNIQIDLSVLNEDESFTFDNVIENALNFIANEANDQVKFNNVFVKDNEKIINIEDLVSNDETIEILPEEEIKIDEIVPDDDKIVAEEIIQEDVNDDFEILKNTINEMIDSIETVEVKNETTETNVINIEETFEKVEVKKDDVEEVVTSEETLSIDEEAEDIKVNESNENEEKDFARENKKDHKDVKRIKIENAKSEYSMQNNDKVKFSPDDLKDVIEDNHISESVTDRYMEAVSVAKQMVKGVELKLSETTQEMNIKLDPENLGKVNLKIVTENGLVTAKFEAENQKVKEIIESNLSLLKESLEKRGVEVSALNVSVNQNMNQNSNKNDIESLREIAKGKNPHKILGKSIKNFITSAEINNSELKKRGLYMTRSQVNYIA